MQGNGGSYRKARGRLFFRRGFTFFFAEKYGGSISIFYSASACIGLTELLNVVYNDIRKQQDIVFLFATAEQKAKADKAAERCARYERLYTFV